MMATPKIICVTPVKNEEWILDLFLQVTSQVADQILIADQGSTDGTRAICARYPKVTVVENNSPSFNEPERQALLIGAARRRFPGPKLLLALDADEILSANLLDDPEWKAALQAPPGVPIELQNVCLFGSSREYRSNVPGQPGVASIPYAMVDNDAPHVGLPIHSPRLPFRADVPPIRLARVVNMHYQFVDLERAMAKQRWYLCYERLRFPEKPAVEIVERYRWVLHDVHTWTPQSAPVEWREGWERRGINLDGVARSQYFWWTWETLRYFARHGEEHFADLPLWEYDWEGARQAGLERGIANLPQRPVRDPRLPRVHASAAAATLAPAEPDVLEDARRAPLPALSEKLAVVSPVLPPAPVGQAVVLQRILRGFEPRSYCLLSPEEYSEAVAMQPLLDQCVPYSWSMLPARYHPLPLSEPSGGLLSRLPGVRKLSELRANIARRAEQIVAVVRREGCGAILACSGDLLGLPASYLASRICRVPFYAYLFEEYASHRLERGHRLLMRYLERRFLRGAAGVVVTNEALAAEYRRRYRISPTVIHNPCELAVDAVAGTESASEGTARVVYTGSCGPAQQAAFRTLGAALAHAGRDVRLHLYGATASEAESGEGIVAHGCLTAPQAVAVQRRAAILFLPLPPDTPTPEVARRYEPAKMGEYLASGRPILVRAPADSYVSDYFRRHDCGLVVEDDDPQTLAQAVGRLLDEPDLTRRLSENARARAQADFGLVSARDRLARLLEVGGSRKRR